MKLNTDRANIERGGVHSESAFTIKTNALSFSILSSGLYTDREMAIVRELSCNAYDAHVLAKNQHVPFDIHLPNKLEPFLSIKDYGTGLSDADIQGEAVTLSDGTISRTGGLYTTYFDSTKTNSNDYIGALGLGSKSPFSYSDAFEVISRFDGIKRTYAIFLSEDGIPTIALMGEIPTDEHCGLEVKIAISEEDFYIFERKTRTALKYFKVKPNVTGTLRFEFDKIPDVKMQTDEWMMTGISFNSDVTAVQGNVAYRVDYNQINELLGTRVRDFIKNSSVILFFNIGELEVSANREEIRYDKRTLASIVTRITNMHNEFTHEVEKLIGDVNSKYWFACIELNKLSQKVFGKQSSIYTFVNPDKVTNPILKEYNRTGGTVTYSRLSGYEVYRYTSTSSYNTRLKRGKLSQRLTPTNDTMVVINDIKTGGILRLSNYIEEHAVYDDAIVLIKRNDPLLIPTATPTRTHPTFLDDVEYIEFVGYETELKKFLAELGSPECNLLSEITTAPAKTVSKKLPFYKCSGLHVPSNAAYHSTTSIIMWEKAKMVSDEGGIYIPLKFGSTISRIDQNGEFSSMYFTSDKKTMAALVFLIDEYNEVNKTYYGISSLGGFPVTTYKKLKKDDRWINLFDFAKDRLLQYVDVIQFQESIRTTSCVLGAKDMLGNEQFVKRIKELNNRSTFKKAMLPLIEGHEKSKKISADPLAIVELYKAIFNEPLSDDNYYDHKAFDKYPMLTLIETLGYNSQWDILFNYIKLIDRSK